MYYPSSCTEIETFECCPTYELGRVRSLALIHQSYYETLSDDPTDDALWYAGKATGKIFAYENTNGEYDGGSAINTRGFGYGETRYMATNFNLDAVVNQYNGNRNHFNPLQGSNNYYLAWCTDSITFLTEKPVTIIITNPIANDITKKVAFKINAKWTDRNLPIEIAKSDTQFACLNFNCVGIGCVTVESTFIVG